MIVSKERVYGKIKNMVELAEMHQAAASEGLTAVGITDGGSIYIYDPISETAKPIDAAKATEILNLTEEQFLELFNSRGEKDIFAEVSEEIEETSVDTQETAVEEVVVDPEVVVEESQEDNATFQEEIVEVSVEDGPTPEAQEQEEVKEPEVEEVIHECPVCPECPECEDCSVHVDKILLAKASIKQKIEQIDDFKEYLQGLLEVLE